MEKETQESAVVVTDEPADEVAQAELDAFDSGYSGTVEEPTENPPPVETPAPSETPAPVETPVSADPPVAPVVSDAQLKDLLAKVNTVDELKLAIEKLRGDAFGKVGGLERTLKQIQEATPIGQPIEVKAEDLKGIEAEFPGLNLAPALAKDLTAVLSKMKGTGSAPSGMTPDEIKAQIDAARSEGKADTVALLEEERKRIAIERLTDVHEDWQTVIGPPDKPSEFRTWLKGEGEAKEKAFLESWDPRLIGKTLSQFKEAKKAPPKPKPTDSRGQRLAEAVPAKGGGVPTSKSKVNEEELAFEAGYKGH